MREYNRLSVGKSKDSSVITKLNGQIFYCPFSHKLLFYQKQFPLYDRQLAKLCFFMQQHMNGGLKIIDVGANVGDTVLNIGIKNAFYLCVEGDKTFSDYIDLNLRKYQFSIEQVYLSDKDEDLAMTIERSNGTAHLVQRESNNHIKLYTLDSLLHNRYSNMAFDLLKIDTDGFDFKVIRGAKNYLEKFHPLVFFEWDKSFCKEQGINHLEIFSFLKERSYKECLLFDNYGNLFTRVKTDDYERLKIFIENTHKEGLPYYYDVLAVPEKSLFDIDTLYSIFLA